MSLNLLLDNADPAAWAYLLPLGIFKGITTNPTLLKKARQPCDLSNLKKLAKEASRLGCKELHLQVWGQSKKDMSECGIALAQLKTSKMKVYVKIPVTKTGCEVARKLINSNISVTLTACYETKQILIAAGLKASYIAPYMSRISDLGQNGLAEIISMQKTLKGIRSNCKLLVASIRESHELIHLASNGISTFTINTSVAEELFSCQNTLEAARKFNLDALYVEGS